MQEVPKQESKLKTLIALIIIVLCVGAGSAYAGWKIGYQKGSTEAAAETAEKYKEAVSPFMPPLPEEVTSFSGTVDKIEGKTLYLKGAKPTRDILEMRKTITMKVKTTDKTKFYKLEMVPLKEMTPPKEGEEEFTPPEPFKKITVKFEEIKKGMLVTATAKDNIIGKTEFEATEVEIHEMPPEML